MLDIKKINISNDQILQIRKQLGITKKQPKFKRTSEMVDMIIKLSNEGKLVKEIASRVGLSIVSVSRIRSEFNLKIKRNVRKSKVTNETIYAVHKFISDKKTAKEISDILDINIHCVYRIRQGIIRCDD